MMSSLCKTNRLQWWLLLVLNISFLLVGQTAATLLGRFYYDQGGNSKWLSTLVQTAAFPLLFLPLIFLPDASSPSSTPRPPATNLILTYTVLGLIVAADNLMYSYGLLYLPVSTYSLICASQLAFNAVFAYFLNSQKFTPLILNSVVLLSFSSTLLGINEESSDNSTISSRKYTLGFILTLGASATYSLILSLMQLAFQKVIKKETFTVVLEMQIYTATVATCASVVGLFASGEWKGLGGEYEGFAKGKTSYVMTVVAALIWRAITRARGLKAEQPTSCSLAINNRERLRPKQSAEYFGNSINVLHASAAAGELLGNGLGWAARELNRAIAAHTDAAIRGLLRAYHEAPMVYSLTMFDQQKVTMASSPRFDMYGCDFGFGKAAAVRCGPANKFDGNVFAFPGREGGGSVDLEVCLIPEYMAALLEDNEFTAAVSPSS